MRFILWRMEGAGMSFDVVVFVEYFVNGNKRWEVDVVMKNCLGRMEVPFVVV